jgi:inositol transport system permease protein
MTQTTHGVGGLTFDASKRSRPPELNIFIGLVLIVLLFEALGWLFVGNSFLFNTRPNVDAIFNYARLQIIILQVSIVGIIAIGVTQVIISGGIDLSSGSIVAATAMIAMSFAQVSVVNGNPNPKMMLPGGWQDLPVLVPIIVGLGCGMIAGLINGFLIAYTRIPPFIATLGMMVTARGVARWWSKGEPISFPTDSYAAIGKGMMPVLIFIGLAILFHLILRYTVYGKHSYAIGSNEAAATMSGMGMMYELDAIAMSVIGGVSLTGGRGSIFGTVLGALIFGVIISGFTFLKLDAFYQEMVKGVIIVAAVVLDQWRQRRAAARV